MEKHQASAENKEDTANALKKKTNQDFNGKTPLPNDPGFKKEEPDTEVPGIDDGKERNPGVTRMEEERNKDTQKKKIPTKEEPLNPRPKNVVEGDSDAPTA